MLSESELDALAVEIQEILTRWRGNAPADKPAPESAPRAAVTDAADIGAAGPAGGIGTLAAVGRRTGQRLRHHHLRRAAAERAYFRDVLLAAAERGELRPDVDLDQLFSLIVGAFYADHLAGRPRGEGWSRSVVRLVLAAGADRR